MKKNWEKPVLTSLFRGKPEENVLCGCKTRATSGPTNARGQCDLATGLAYQCQICHSPYAT